MTTKYNMTAAKCANTAPEFTVTNPFELGLVYYFNRQNYYFSNNVTETFAHSSIYSRPFAEVMTNLTRKFKIETLGSLTTISQTLNLMNYVAITIDLFYILAFLLLYYFFRRSLASIKLIIDFFR